MNIALLYYYILYLYTLHNNVHVIYRYALYALYVHNKIFVLLLLYIMLYVYINPSAEVRVDLSDLACALQCQAVL